MVTSTKTTSWSGEDKELDCLIWIWVKRGTNMKRFRDKGHILRQRRIKKK